MCSPKEEGGLGFRDLYAHNLALLAKQAWRLMHFPNSLIAQVIRAKYFPLGDILTEVMSSFLSSCWHGIFESLIVLKKGVRWQIVNDSSVHIWSDPWVPRPHSFRACIHRPGAPVRVSELILPTRYWNIPLISQMFDVDDAHVILSIPLSWCICADRCIWHFDSRGSYTIKSGYKLAVDMVHGSVVSGSDHSVQFVEF